MEQVEEEMLDQAEAVREYLEWEIERLQACIAEMRERFDCCECRVKRQIAKTI